MSWLRSSPLRQSLTRSNNSNVPQFLSAMTSTNSGGIGSQSSTASTSLRSRPIDTATDCDPRACYDSFCKHWQQAYEIIQRSQTQPQTQKPPTHDDVLGVVSHLDFMVTLLLVELHNCNKITLPTADATPPPAPCLEFMLSENLLDKLYEWGCTTGRYANAVRLEQLKLYELLVSHSRHQLLCHEPFLRPLLKILASSQGEIYPPDLEKRLVILLNQLCVVLMQNVHLLDLFFFSAAQEQQQKNSGPTTNFIIFSLLIPYVHREGSLGHQARDALLLCMALSQKNSNIGTYIAQYSSMCPLLVTGLGGLYSRLPNSIEITSIDWHRITPDDVTEISELTLFMNALEFCNAVVQVAHEMIKNQLLDFMYQGFIVPVLGPAILQTLKGKHFQTNVESQISTMSYLDLILRSVTEPGLLRAFVKFLLDTEKFDGERILDTLVERLTSTDANLCMVTMALFDTLLGLHCEDLMLELLLKYLLPGKHVPISYRHKINKIDPYTNTAEFLLELTPDVMKRVRELTKHKSLGDTVTNNNNTNNSSQIYNQPMLPSPTSTMSKTIGANWNYYGLHSGDSLYANYHAYLFEARYRVGQCQNACTKWANSYKYQRWPPKLRTNALALDMVKQFFNEFSASPVAVASLGVTATGTSDQHGHIAYDNGEKKQFDSLQSIGESSGYESFKWRPAEEEAYSSTGAAESDLNASSGTTQHSANLNSSTTDTVDMDAATAAVGGGRKQYHTSQLLHQQKTELWRISSNNRNDIILTDYDFSEDLFAQGTVSLGPFLNAIWGKLQTFTSNTLYVNLHLTGLITHLAWYPLPLIHSLLLRPDIVITSDTPSFHQVLRILKQQIDAELPVIEDSLELIDVARSYLIDREFRLINSRKANENSPLHLNRAMTSTATQQQRLSHHHHHHLQTPTTTYANISSSTPIQAMPSSTYDPFKRSDTKRKSISKSITSMFSRKSNASSGFSQIYAFFTGSSPSTNLASSGSGGAGGGIQTSSSSSYGVTTITTDTTATTTTTMSSSSNSSSQQLHSNINATMVGGTHETSLSTLPTSPPPPSTTSSSRKHQHQQQQQQQVFNEHEEASYSSSSSLATIGGGSTTSALSTAISNVSTLLGGSTSVGGGGNSEPASLDSVSSMGAIANTGGTERTRDLALCAVLLDEWLKELAAIAQEQNVVLVGGKNI